MYSIDKNVKTLSLQQTIDKWRLENDGQRIIEWTRQEVLVNLVREIMTQGETDFVVSLLPERPGGQFNIIVSACAIPGEYRRMLNRIDKLENELLISKHAPTYYGGSNG